MEKLIEVYRNRLIDEFKFPVRKLLTKKQLQEINDHIDKILKEFKTEITEKINNGHWTDAY